MEPGAALYPDRQARRTHRLDVGDGHLLRVAEFGPARGLPALFLHGGPGSGCDPGQARLFHPSGYRLIQLDQRGCGGSTPAGSLHANHTGALVADIERVRMAFGIRDWLVYGGSWGATLAIEYAKRHPERVRTLVLRGVFLARPEDLDWFAGPTGCARQLPQAYASLCAALGLRADAGLAPLLESLHSQLLDRSLALGAARAWEAWERAVLGLPAPPLTPDIPGDDAQRLRLIWRKRIHVHYCRTGFFLGPQGCLDGIEALNGLPLTLIHGENDRVCPPEGARLLAAKLPRADLRLIPDAGHLAGDPAIAAALRSALDAALPLQP